MIEKILCNTLFQRAVINIYSETIPFNISIQNFLLREWILNDSKNTVFFWGRFTEEEFDRIGRKPAGFIGVERARGCIVKSRKKSTFHLLACKPSFTRNIILLPKKWWSYIRKIDRLSSHLETKFFFIFSFVALSF